MTDAEATAAIEILVGDRKWKLVYQARKFADSRNFDEASDMIQEALISAWAHRAKIECMEAYVMGAIHFQAVGWVRNKKKEFYSDSMAGLTNHSAVVQAITLRLDPHARTLGENGDSRKAIRQFRESQRMEDLTSTINACADMLTPHQRRNLEDLMARDGANGGENHGGSHAVEIRDSRVRLIMRGKRDKLNSKVRRAAA